MMESALFAKLGLMGLLLCWLATDAVNAECKGPLELPAKLDNGAFTCAYIYDGRPSDEAINSCNGFEHPLDESTDLNEPPCGWHYAFSAVVVRPACELYTWDSCNFEGNMAVYQGPTVVPHIAENTIGSLKCRCGGLRHVTCVPTDGMVHIMTCDATGASSPTTCKYTKTVGVSYETSISESMSVDISIEMALEMEFFGLFSYHLGFSMSTGYDWTQTATEAMSQTQTFEVEASAEPGKVLTIEQATGFCDGSTVYTEYFKITHTDKHGKVLDVYYEKTLPDGSSVRV